MIFIYALVGRLISAFGVLLLNIAVARCVDLNSAGEFFLYFALLNLIVIICKYGQDLVILRDSVAVRSDNIQRSLSSVASYFLLSSALIVVFLFCALLYTCVVLSMEGQTPLSIWGALLTCIPLTLLGGVSAWLKSRGHQGIGALFEGGGPCLLAALLVFVLAGNEQTSLLIVWIVYSMVSWLALLVSGFYMLRLVRANVGDLWGLFEVSLLKSKVVGCLFDSFSFFQMTLVSYLSQWLGVILTGLYLLSSDVSIYNVVLRVLVPLQFVQILLDQFLSPRLSSANTSKDAYEKLTRLLRFSRLVGSLSAIGFLGVYYYLGDPIVRFCFGDEYISSVEYIFPLALAFCISLCLGANGALLNMCNRQRISLKIVWVQGIITISCFMILVPTYGIWGGVISQIIGVLYRAIHLYLSSSSYLRAKVA